MALQFTNPYIDINPVVDACNSEWYYRYQTLC